jgi:nucleosome assembly protein 1-like 1
MNSEQLNKIKEAITKKCSQTPELMGTLGALFVQLEKTTLADDNLQNKNDEFSFKHYQKETKLVGETVNMLRSLEVPEGNAIQGIEKNLKSTFFTDEERNTSHFNEQGQLKEKLVDNIWTKMFYNCEEINSMIQKEDKEVLKHLDRIELLKSSPKDFHFVVNFYFNPNEYFSNELLWIKAERDPEGMDSSLDNSDIILIESNKIHWKPNKNLTKKKVKKKQRNKRTGQTRTLEKLVVIESFFNIFCNIAFDDVVDDDDAESLNSVPDPTSEKEIFFMATDFLELISSNFFTYLVPVTFDILPEMYKIPEVKGVTDIVGNITGKNQKECKQQ